MGEWNKADFDPSEYNGSGQQRTYIARIKVDIPSPTPKTATARMVDGEFVWERSFKAKGRAAAVRFAGDWFNEVKRKDYAKHLKGKLAHDCVTVDDSFNEVRFGSSFNPDKPLHRLLDKETIQRLLEQSEGLLKVNQIDPNLTERNGTRVKAQPSVAWVDESMRINKAPIKIAFNTHVDPKQGMAENMKQALERARKLRKKGTNWMKQVEKEHNRKLIQQMRDSGLIG